MKNLIKTLFLLVATTILGCSHYNIQLADLYSGKTLKGRFDISTHEVNVSMPDGIKLNGKYVEIKDDGFVFGLDPTKSVFSGTSFGTFSTSESSPSLEGKSICYSILSSPDTKLMMEVLIRCKKPFNRTFIGEARTNDGSNYHVIFPIRRTAGLMYPTVGSTGGSRGAWGPSAHQAGDMGIIP